MSTPTDRRRRPAPHHRRGSRATPTPDSHSFPTRPYDLVKEFVIALVVVGLLTVGLAAVFSSPDEKAITMRTGPPGGAGRRRRDRRRRAGRHDDQRRATAPPYNTQRRRPASSARSRCRSGPGSGSRSTRRRTSSSQPLAGSRATRPWPRRWPSGTPAGADQRTAWATAYADALAKAPDGDPAQVAGRRLRAGPGAGRRLPGPRPHRRPRGHADLVGHLLRRRPDPLAAAAVRRRLPRGPGAGPQPRRRPVGHDERDRQLPRPAVDVALHVLVPGPAVLHLRERRRPGLGADDGADPRPGPAARSSPGCARSRGWIPVHRLVWRDYYRNQA